MYKSHLILPCVPYLISWSRGPPISNGSRQSSHGRISFNLCGPTFDWFKLFTVKVGSYKLNGVRPQEDSPVEDRLNNCPSDEKIQKWHVFYQVKSHNMCSKGPGSPTLLWTSNDYILSNQYVYGPQHTDHCKWTKVEWRIFVQVDVKRLMNLSGILMHIAWFYTPSKYHLFQNQLMIENDTTIVLW